MFGIVTNRRLDSTWVTLLHLVLIKDRWLKTTQRLVGQSLPLFDLQLSALKALVVRLRLGLVVWVVVLREVGVSQSLGCRYPLVCIQNQHFLQKVHSLWVGTDEHISKVPLGHVCQGADVVPGLMAGHPVY